MDKEKLKDRLSKIYKLDPYWQKWEWIKIKDDDPELYKLLREIDDTSSTR